ncbi:OprD family porin [Endozoicomonas euniceicola]|uniref:OprD family porin n=1 Tax=Endozoicomonas euniceicola TaxID=1234143 RepID=A0ABY6GSD8_9GAMM|nr:OprD family porin [Endozoicomonas euniceicola]UYM15667.1 OprD family porin [Endozoicomonas euniceicola]
MLNKVMLTIIVPVILTSTSSLASNNNEFFHSGLPEREGHHFIEDAKVSGNIYNLTRIRDRRDDVSNSFKENLYHSTTLLNLDFTSGLLSNLFGLNAGIFGTWDIWNSGTSQLGESSLIDDKGRIKNGISIYKAAARLESASFKAHAGYIQPSGPGVLGVNWSFVPGTYRGGEGIYRYGGLTVACMWVDRYKKPWIYDTKSMLRKDGSKIPGVYSIGGSYDFNVGISVLAGFGQADDFIDLYKLKLTYAGHHYTVSYHFYGMNDKDNSGIVWNADNTSNTTNDIFDGLVYQHALMTGFHLGRWMFRAEATYTQAWGSESNFAFRPTGYNGGFGGSNGAYEVWWDSRSDFNHNGEKALFFGAWYDFGQGWRVGVSYAHGWDGKPNTLNPGITSTRKLEEQAYNVDVGYTFLSGYLKGGAIKVHGTLFKNRTNLPSWSREFPNAFKDEKDVKLIFSAPWL